MGASNLVPKIVLKQQLEPIQIKQVQDEPELLRANIPFQSHRIYQAMKGYSPVNRQKLPAINSKKKNLN